MQTHLNPKVRFLKPKQDCPNPILSIVIPAANEEKTIEEFIKWCKIGINEANIEAEILIISSSNDRTSTIALQQGARVLETHKEGLGKAYKDSLDYIRGDYVILGDADCTYDFRDIKNFIDKFTHGYEFIMGTRFKGFIEKGSMPILHQYFGTPITTWILNKIFKSNFSDIHCGMRGITKSALKKMNLVSNSWEYASEMVIKSIQMKLKTSEVGVKFYKDRNNRVSHHIRDGFFSPFKAGFLNLKAMMIFGSEYIFKLIGNSIISLFLPLGIILTIVDLNLKYFYLSSNSALVSFLLVIIALQLQNNSTLAKMIHSNNINDVESIKKHFLGKNLIRVNLLSIVLGIVLVSVYFFETVKIRSASQDFLFFNSIESPLFLGVFLLLSAIQFFLQTLIFQATYFKLMEKK